MNIELDNFIKFADRNSLIYKPSRYSNQFDNIIDTGNTVLFNKLYKLSILKPEHIISLAIILFKKGYKKESNNILDNNVLNTQQFTDEELFYNLISCNDYNFYMRIKPMFDISKLSLFYLKKQNDFYIKMFNKNISKDINNHIEAKIKKLEDDFNFKISHTGEMYYLPQYNIELFPKRLKIIIRKLLETQNKSSLNVNYFNYIISSINYLLIHYSNINIDLLCNRLEFINKSLFLDNTYTQRNINYYKPFCMRNNHSDYFIYYNQKRFLKLYFPDSYILSIYSLRFYNNKYLFLKRNGYEDKDILKRKPSSLTSIEKHINALYLKEVQKKLPLRARKH